MHNLPKQKDLPFELANFQVEELEERLENRWGTCHCPIQQQNPETGAWETTYVECDCDSPFRDEPPGGWHQE